MSKTIRVSDVHLSILTSVLLFGKEWMFLSGTRTVISTISKIRIQSSSSSLPSSCAANTISPVFTLPFVSSVHCTQQVLEVHSVSVLPKPARQCKGLHWITSLLSSTLLLLQYPAYLIRLIRMFLEIGGRWPCSCYFWDIASRICSV